MKYEVLLLSTYGEEETSPDIRANNMRYPELLRHIKDEEELMVIEPRTCRYWPASEFFHMTGVKKFEVLR